MKIKGLSTAFAVAVLGATALASAQTTSTGKSAARKATDEVRLIGCVQPSVSTPATSTTHAATSFVLVTSAPAAAAIVDPRPGGVGGGEAAPRTGTSVSDGTTVDAADRHYLLLGDDVSGYVGRQVEVTGTLAPPAKAASSARKSTERSRPGTDGADAPDAVGTSGSIAVASRSLRVHSVRAVGDDCER